MEDSVPEVRTAFERLYRPTDGMMLYHYCDTPAFLSIIESGRLRFSDANMMNDGSEGRYGYALFERAANTLIKSAEKTRALKDLTPDFFDKVDDYLSPKQLASHPVIACFSKEPDVLSQWRAYAQDGEGWSIGFDAEALDAMPVTLLDVLYDPDQQLEEVRNHLVGIFFLWSKHGGEFRDAVGKEVALLSSWLHAYKDPSFREEQEVRALHELRVDIAEDGLLLTDEGGTANGAEVVGEPLGFRASGSKITAYVDIPFKRPEDRSIVDVWLGPRNDNGPGNALYPLTQFGHRAVTLRQSASFYRG